MRHEENGKHINIVNCSFTYMQCENVANVAMKRFTEDSYQTLYATSAVFQHF